MTETAATQNPTNPKLAKLSVRSESDFLILSPNVGRPFRRILYINSYGGAKLWDKIKRFEAPAHHLWGCLELACRGYEVAVAEPLQFFYLRKNAFPHDLRLFSFIRDWLGRDGIVYCGHTLLYWLPILRRIRLLRCPIVSLTYARERLDFSSFHSGAVAMTPAAADELRRNCPTLKVAHLPWGCDLNGFPAIPYNPRWFLSCGIANRDFATLSQAAAHSDERLRVICPGLPSDINWSSNVEVTDSGKGWSVDQKKVAFKDLLHDYYSNCSASLVILKQDHAELTANGMTNLLEGMAMSRPVIMTKTGAVPGELDVEKAGCGLFVPPGDAHALADAFSSISADPDAAREMGQRGRRLAESHYNIDRFAEGLHSFFQSM